MMTILNLTQHSASAEQKADRCVDLTKEAQKLLREYLTFDTLPDADEVVARANDIAELSLNEFVKIGDDGDGKCAMIGGAPYLMVPLYAALEARGFEVCYAFSKRVSVERVGDDGSIMKTSVFKHAGYVWS